MSSSESHMSSSESQSQSVEVSSEEQSGNCAWRSQNPDANAPYTFSSNECCDSRLSRIMRDAAANSITSPQLGDAARYIQRRIQLDYMSSFEVIISKGDFATSTYYHGLSTCKIHDGEYNLLAYETPVQYNPFNVAQEDLLASADSEEPLGDK
ncbi:ground-like domain protein [Cooperia oncophora]